MKALVVSQYVETRLPLLQVTTRISRFREVFSVHTLEEAEQTLIKERPMGIVLVSNTYEAERLAPFIERVKRMPGHPDCAFILVLNSEGQDSATVAQNMLYGIHGFLMEPFSYESVDHAVQLALAVKMQNSAVRMRAATGLMLSDVMAETDPQKGSKGDLWDRVQDGCRRFKELTGESVSVSVIKELKEAPASQRVPRYSGVSARVKSVFERKFREHLQRLKRASKPSP